jgi:protein arginine N-methyltransferase 5
MLQPTILSVGIARREVTLNVLLTQTQYLAPRSDNLHNVRYAKNTFKISQAASIHGIAGYFETVLYKDVMLSTCNGL